MLQRGRRDLNTLTLPPKRSNHPVGILPPLFFIVSYSYNIFPFPYY